MKDVVKNVKNALQPIIFESHKLDVESVFSSMGTKLVAQVNPRLISSNEVILELVCSVAKQLSVDTMSVQILSVN